MHLAVELFGPVCYFFLVNFLSPNNMVCVCVCVCVWSHFSRVQLFATLWTVAHQAPQSTGYSRQEYWSGLSCPSSGDLTNPGTEPMSVMSPALGRWVLYHSAMWEAPNNMVLSLINLSNPQRVSYFVLTFACNSSQALLFPRVHSH